MHKIQTLKAGEVLRRDGVIAHQTSTLAGIAANVQSLKAIRKAQTFKQRQAPFLLLADSVHTALQQAIYISPKLRKLAKSSWPGAVTLVFRAKKRLNPACYQKGCIAIRVDSDAQTRQLAKACGGLMLSSSFNRKNQAVQPLQRQQRYRQHRFVGAVLARKTQGNTRASSIYKITPQQVIQLR